MAEFCLECWNRMNDTNYTEKDFIISDELDLCEGCAEYKQVIVCARNPYEDMLKYAFAFIWYPFVLIREIVRFGGRHILRRYHKRKRTR